MANPAHLKILGQGVDAWNEWRRAYPKIWHPDVIKANLAGVQLDGANLEGANLSGANLVGAVLAGAELYEANLDGADLCGADLSLVDLTEATLREANLRDGNLVRAYLFGAALSGADLSRAYLLRTDLGQANLNSARLVGAELGEVVLSGANLSGADLTGAFLWSSIFDAVDLSVVRGLDTVEHGGPSTIGIDTIYLSKGNIPEVFLRGAGVPEDFIIHVASLVGKPIEFYSCFLSYSNKDQEFAERLYADLQSKGVRCWFAPHDAQGGKKLHAQIDAAIRLHEKLLLILSPDSMNSQWVKTEIGKARKREVDEKRQVLFPLRLCSFEKLRDWECFDADTGKDSALEIREYYIPDFSNWNDHDSYQKAFKRLLGDLKAEELQGETS